MCFLVVANKINQEVRMWVGLTVSEGKEQMRPYDFKQGQDSKKKWWNQECLGEVKEWDLSVIGWGKVCLVRERMVPYSEGRTPNEELIWRLDYLFTFYSFQFLIWLGYTVGWSFKYVDDKVGWSVIEFRWNFASVCISEDQLRTLILLHKEPVKQEARWYLKSFAFMYAFLPF